MNKDRLSKERRSWNMSRIRGKDTTPEKIVRSLLHRMGYRFRLHVRIPTLNSPRRRGGAEVAGSAKLPLHLGLAAQQCRFTSLAASIGERARGEVSTHSSVPRSELRTPRSVSVDILLPKHKTAIFVHGCFWHRHAGCKNCTTPTNRRGWWLAKLNGNAARDKLHQAALRKLGWRVIVIWECQSEKPESLERLTRELMKILKRQSGW